MKPLPNTFSRDGYPCQVLKREDNIVLVQVGQREHYEVAIVQRIKAKNIKGVPIPAHEALPSASKWGMLGWSLLSLNDAEAKFTKELRKVRQKRLKAAA